MTEKMAEKEAAKAKKEVKDKETKGEEIEAEAKEVKAKEKKKPAEKKLEEKKAEANAEKAVENAAKTEEKTAKKAPAIEGKAPAAKARDYKAKERTKTRSSEEEDLESYGDDAELISKEGMLVEGEKYLKSGAHIGARTKTGTMSRFVYKTRKDGLKVMDVQVLDERLSIAANLIASIDAEKIAVVSRKVYGAKPAKTFSQSIGAKAFTGRFIPGTFTNPESSHFFEPRLVIVTDPENDFQAIIEAQKIKAPVIALASTNNETKNIDLIIPINNKGRKSLALAYWILARETLIARGELKDRESFGADPTEYVFKLSETTELGRAVKPYGKKRSYR